MWLSLSFCVETLRVSPDHCTIKADRCTCQHRGDLGCRQTSLNVRENPDDIFSECITPAQVQAHAKGLRNNLVSWMVRYPEISMDGHLESKSLNRKAAGYYKPPTPTFTRKQEALRKV